ncbi:MAG TPA: selenide, water dikinase SelD [Bryobacteraceae bacterium]|nr:selenide, water dikinase SelD [Bryobacteraceae bacterium]
MSTVRLTASAKAGGCASKLSPRILDQVLPRLPRIANENVLVGFETSDDAGVYRLSADSALVQTVDFFTPVVDDPFTFGAVAAANALSDVYAMGGRPITALSILAFPGKGNLDVLEQMLQGGTSKMREAACPVIGGHSVNSEELKFGYAVTGLVHPDRIWKNTGARAGDVLMFTKRIGTGVISTALKRGFAQQEHVTEAIDSMLALNLAAAEALQGLAVHSCTDVTGFGLIGHAREMALGSDVTLELDAQSVPLLPGALDYAKAGAISGGLNNNREFASCVVEMRSVLAEAMELILYDPQTSGGLLVSMPAADGAEFQKRFNKATRIGRVLVRQDKPIRIV